MGKIAVPAEGSLDEGLRDEEWVAERAQHALLTLRDCVEVNAGKRGSIPVLRGTRFTLSQLFAEISEGRSLLEIAADFGLDLDQMKKFMESFSIHIDRPVAQ
jgi:uncharacterized protein (DUF433 family)